MILSVEVEFMQSSRIVIPVFLCAVSLLGCESTPDESAWLGLAPGESDDGNADLGVADTEAGESDGTETETETGEEDGSGALRIVLGGDGSPFINGTLNTFAGGSFDGLVVSIYIDSTGSKYEWLRYHGGLKNEAIRDLDIDTTGRICASGWTNSTNLPVSTHAAQNKYGGGTRDLFIGCWNAEGGLSYSTYFGGLAAELNETALSVSGDTLVVTGSTNSLNLATTPNVVQPMPPAGNNGLVFTYGPNGAIAWGSYLGGAGVDSVGLDNDVGLDGDIWMIGSSTSVDFPVTDGSVLGGVEDSAIARLSSDGSTLELATLLGGSAGDYGRVIKALPDGTAVTCTNTYSEDFPVGDGAWQSTHASQQAGANYDLALSHIDSDGSILAATYLGSTGFDACLFLDVDAEGSVYVAGWTDNLSDFPLTTDDSVFGPWAVDMQQGFLAKLDPDLEAVEYAVRTTVARAMDVLDDGRVVLLAPENPGLTVTANAIPGESSNALVVYEPDGVTPEYLSYVMGEGMFVEVLQAVELP